MVPPPDNTGDEFPDFENMSFEEQMAWLESLAKRQGAGQDELTTSADLDIPLPENAEVDEPGYVPFEGSRSAREMQQKMAADSAHPEPEEPQEPVSSVPEDDEADAPPEPAYAVSQTEGDDDPMNWLDSLTVQPDQEEGQPDLFAESEDFPSEEPEDLLAVLDEFDDDADTRELFAEFDEEPIPDTGELTAAYDEELQSAVEQEQPPVEAAAEAPAGDADDPLGGMDPMAWLESLAKRQGASDTEFTTSADLEIDEVPENTVVDEPGYVPFEGSRSARELQQSVSLAAQQPEIEEPAESPADMFSDKAEVPDEGEAEAALDWLEPLSQPQETAEGMAASAGDEARTVAYDAAEEMFEEQVTDDGLSWLEDLAAEPDEDVSDFLALEDESADLAPPAAVPELESEIVAPAEAAEADDPLAGMTDEDIAQAQAEGTLTPQQELAWLKRQARALAEAREAEAAEQAEELPPAEPADLPPWLQEIRETSEREAVAEADELLGEVEEAESDLPDWLAESPEADLPVMAEEAEDDVTELSFDEDVETLWDDTAEPELPDLDLLGPESELAAFVSGDFVPDEPDMLADALDEEFDRRQFGEEEEPEWYTEAVARVAAEAPALSESEQDALEDEQEEPEEPVLTAAEPVEAPGWLEDESALDVDEAVPLDESEMPDWLRGTGAEPADALAEGDMPDWLQEAPELEAELEGDIPDWLQEMAPEDLQEPEPEAAPEAPAEPPAAPAPAPAPVEPEVPLAVAEAALPEGELFEQYRVRLEANPNDHPNRLALARALRANDQPTASLDHYEVLIESAQLLEDVTQDLVDLAQENPDEPRMQRLVGDAYMRQGNLSEALKAYRDALHHL